MAGWDIRELLDRTDLAALLDEVPGPGGRRGTWTTVDGRNRKGPLAPDAETTPTIECSGGARFDGVEL